MDGCMDVCVKMIERRRKKVGGVGDLNTPV